MIVGFACLSLTVTTQKANACIPWTPCLDPHYTTNALYCLDENESLLKILVHPSNSLACYRPELNL